MDRRALVRDPRARHDALMAPEHLRKLLGDIPAPVLLASPAVADGIDESLRYLASDEALASIAADTYRPKWNSPWWHMLLLHELGEAGRIPQRAVRAMMEGLARLRIHVFPVRPEDTPPGADSYRDSLCHCALGSMTQLLTACGVDVGTALPWTVPWFARYQMPDGGLSCDTSAYLVADECPSSMVGTVAPFEAVLDGALSEERRLFLTRAAGFLVARRLVLGSPTKHNADERTSAPAWRLPCFPRFYFYDVLRGTSALVRWALVSGEAIPLAGVSLAAMHLARAYPDGVIRIGRRVRRLDHPPACERRLGATAGVPVRAARRDERRGRTVPDADAPLERRAPRPDRAD